MLPWKATAGAFAETCAPTTFAQDSSAWPVGTPALERAKDAFIHANAFLVNPIAAFFVVFEKSCLLPAIQRSLRVVDGRIFHGLTR
jgi:hypothetical protein